MSDTENKLFNESMANKESQVLESNESSNLLKEKIISLEQELNVLKNQGTYTEPEYKYKNEKILRPAGYNPTKQDILLAKARYAMEEDIYQIIHDMQNYIDLLEGKNLSFPYNEENIKKYYKNSVQKWDKAMENWTDDNELFEALVDDKWFKECYIDGLQDIHMGDCTAYATSCMRCHAERMFKIPMTANWGKHEGYKLFAQYAEDIKEKKKQE